MASDTFSNPISPVDAEESDALSAARSNISFRSDGNKDDKKKVKCRQYELEIKDTQWPIIYSPEYNISFCGLENLHPFDCKKWGRVIQRLQGAGMLSLENIVKPMEASEEELLLVHSHTYINNLKWSINVARISEVAILVLLPNYFVQKCVLRPFRFQTSGTIIAARLAMERGWAINVGGGFHHCSSEKGGGFCAYADISLAIKIAMEYFDTLSRVMIIDLDAHQGNGYARDFMNDANVYILDIYNREIYPNDTYAKGAIRRKVELRSFVKDATYLKIVNTHIDSALEEFTPGMVVYNAGTDILEHDPLGSLSITAKGVIDRDHTVFEKCRSRQIPVFMLTSGGYLPESSKVIADSIMNLWKSGLISCEAAELVSKVDVTSVRGLCARFRPSCLARSPSLVEDPGYVDQPNTSLEQTVESSE